jgi:hypothetical protein
MRQVPQLSASRDLNLGAPFDIMLPGSGNHKSLLIGELNATVLHHQRLPLTILLSHSDMGIELITAL